MIAAPLAVLATASAVTLGVLTSGAGVITAASPPEAVSGVSAGDSTPAALDMAGDLDRRSSSRGGARSAAPDPAPAKVSAAPAPLTKIEQMVLPAQVRIAVREADVEQFTTEVLNLWTEPGDGAENTGVVDAGEKVVLTGRSYLGREEIVTGKAETRWVTSGYFSDEKPAEEQVEEPAVAASCSNGTSVSAGVSPNIVAVHEAVCAAFPNITTYGTFRSDGEHAQGIAVDIMVSGDEGYQVADFVRANAAALGVNYVIYSQRIWSVDRGAEGWRGMEDRGSTTANHYDHVHVTTY